MPGISVAGNNAKNLRYVADTHLTAEDEIHINTVIDIIAPDSVDDFILSI